jgi:CheY-like chemotaxis protein
MDVLIVDDDPSVRRTYVKLLEGEGYSVTSASSGFEAFLEVQLRPYHVIVCDVLMPFQRGTDFYRWLKQKFPAMARQVVFVTGWADDPDVRALLDDTGQPYLPKPVEADALLREVDRLAERRPQ